jgi:hypothetical protein
MVRKYFGFKMMIILMVISTNVFAQNPASDFEYTMNQTGNGVIITRYIGATDNVVIPREIEGFPVVEIGRNSFDSNTIIRRITIPEGVTSIESHAFSFCSNIVEVNLPQTLISIDRAAFMNCTNLRRVVIPESVIEWGESVFNGTGLTNIILPQKMEYIPSWMFVGTPLEQIIIPEGVTRIGSGAFANCKRLRVVTLPSTIRNIGDTILPGRDQRGGPESDILVGGVFYNCETLTSIMIPDTVTQVEFIDHDGNYPNEYNFYNFRGCKNISLRIQARLRNLGYSGSFQ